MSLILKDRKIVGQHDVLLAKRENDLNHEIHHHVNKGEMLQRRRDTMNSFTSCSGRHRATPHPFATPFPLLTSTARREGHQNLHMSWRK